MSIPTGNSVSPDPGHALPARTPSSYHSKDDGAAEICNILVSAISAFAGALFAADILKTCDLLEVPDLMRLALRSTPVERQVTLVVPRVLISAARDQLCRTKAAKMMREVRTELALMDM